MPVSADLQVARRQARQLPAELRADIRRYFAAARRAGVPDEAVLRRAAPAAAAAVLLAAHGAALGRVEFLRSRVVSGRADSRFWAAFFAAAELCQYMPGDWIRRQRACSGPSFWGCGGFEDWLIVVIVGGAVEVDEASGRPLRQHARGSWLCGGQARDRRGRAYSPGVRVASLAGEEELCSTLELNGASVAALAVQFPDFGRALARARAARRDGTGPALWRAVRAHLGGARLRAAAMSMPRPPPPWPLCPAAAEVATAFAALPLVADYGNNSSESPE